MGVIFLLLFLAQLRESYVYGSRENLPLFMVIYVVPIAMSLLMIFIQNKVTVSSQGILYNTDWKQYQLDWSEIKRIEIDKHGHKVVFLTSDENKRLAVFGLSCFAGLEERLTLEAQNRHILIGKTGRAAYLHSKNTIAP